MVPTSTHAYPRARLLALLGREAPLFVLGCVYVLVVAATLPQQLVQDSWLALVGGREIVENGLPWRDSLTVWTLGREWIDQQWLAQLALYGLVLAGGVKLALLVHAALLTAAFVLSVTAARRLGASPTSTVLVASVCMLLAPWALQMRAQSAAPLLFAGLLWLLAADSRRPANRVLIALPLVALWANVHGTALLGAALVSLAGAAALYEQLRRRLHDRAGTLRSVALVLAPWPLLLASPYGLSLVGYYRRLLLNPTLHWFIDEWQPSAPSRRTAVFFAVALATVWLVARHGGRLTPFQRIALLLTMASGLLAVRNLVWFAIAATVLLPLAADGALDERARFAALRPLALPAAAVACAAVLTAGAYVASRPQEWFTQAWPRPALPAIASAARSDPALRVMSDDRYADWLLWEEPALRGRVAYDVRFELFRPDQLRLLYRYRNQAGDGWRRAGEGYRLLALDRRAQPAIVEAALAAGAQLVYRDGDLALLLRRSSATPSRPRPA